MEMAHQGWLGLSPPGSLVMTRSGPRKWSPLLSLVSPFFFLLKCVLWFGLGERVAGVSEGFGPFWCCCVLLSLSVSLFSFFFCHCIMGFSFFLFFVLWVFASIGDIGFCSF